VPALAGRQARSPICARIRVEGWNRVAILSFDAIELCY
jgi:hypothetical protein